ncbi:MAG: hypothetical protein K2X87_12060 [Gemmataceae bacterium]|nr:hypothetical protein [Gemmataceae bacterium]
MDGTRDLLDAARSAGLVAGHFRGLLHIAIGRTVTRPDGSVVSTGLTWRELAAVLKLLRFDRELVREFGADPEELSPRDREKFWYVAIARAGVDSAAAVAEADRLVGPLKALGYIVGPSPRTAGRATPVPPPAPPKPTGRAKPKPPPPGKKGKKKGE